MKLPPCVQTCSHARSSLAYERVMEVEDSATIGTILCDSLAHIGAECTKKLVGCFVR